MKEVSTNFFLVIYEDANKDLFQKIIIIGFLKIKKARQLYSKKI